MSKTTSKLLILFETIYLKQGSHVSSGVAFSMQ